MIALLTNRIFLWSVCAGCAVTIVVMTFLMIGESAGRKVAEGRLAKSEKALTLTRAELSLCKINLAGARTALTEQNAAVETWRKTATEAQKRADARAEQARKQGADLRALAARVAAANTTSTDRCKAASDLYLKTIPELH